MDFGDLIEIVFNVLAVFLDSGLEWYRFYACCILSLALIALVHWSITNGTLRVCLSVPIAIGGIGWGIAWEWRSRH